MHGEFERNEGGEERCNKFPGRDREEGCHECENDNVVNPRRT